MPTDPVKSDRWATVSLEEFRRFISIDTAGDK
jgi:hypothetical protein